MTHRIEAAARRPLRAAGLLAAVLVSWIAGHTRADQFTATVTLDERVAESYTGRVYLMFSRHRPQPRFGPSWFRPEPFFAVEVEHWNAGEPLAFDDEALSHPAPLSQLEPGEWNVQAAVRLDPDSPHIGDGEGNGYSETQRITIASGGDPPSIDLRIDQIHERQPLHDTERIQYVSIPSERLSEFHGREIIMHAAVILPEGYDPDSPRRYPAYYWIHGFGGDHRSAPMLAMHMWSDTGHDDDIVRIVPDPLCFSGHHVFADSANNGPRGTAFVREFIPALEQQFNLVSAPTARFLGGHSSGGWSSLWLQLTYPAFFGGTWSVAPDPVTFSDFQQIDLYTDGVNMYRDENSKPRPLAHHNGEPMLFYEDFVAMESVLGDGGQIGSFEWVFSPRGEDGRPEPLFDRTTGAVDPHVARAWNAYDIRLILERTWPELEADLAGKINVIMGAEDTFYLDGAARLLQKTLATLDPSATVEIVSGADHGSVSTPELAARIDRELLAVFNTHHPGATPDAEPVGTESDTTNEGDAAPH